jgi:hypothetical protein
LLSIFTLTFLDYSMGISPTFRFYLRFKCPQIIFYNCAKVGHEADEMLKATLKPNEKCHLPSYFFTLTFLAFVFAIISWLADILLCHLIMTLPFNPQLHALGWHLLTGFGLYTMFVLLLMHRRLVLGDVPRLKWVWGGLLPVVYTLNREGKKTL